MRNRVSPPANVTQMSQMLIQESNNIPQDSERYSVNASSLSSVHTGERWPLQILTILRLFHMRVPMSNISFLSNMSFDNDEN